MRVDPALWCLLVASGLFVMVVFYWGWNFTIFFPFFMTLGFIFDVLFWPLVIGVGAFVLFVLARRLFKF